jgi:hypothetical protein
MKPTFLATIKEGKLYFDRRDLFDLYVVSLSGRVKVIIKRDRKVRSTGKSDDKGNQNGYLWGTVYPALCSYLGYTADEMHHAITNKFLRVGGTDELPKVRSSASLTTLEWEDLMEKIRVWALTELKIIIPTVEDYYNE